MTLTANQLSYERAEQGLLANIHLSVKAGEILHVTGKNGSGKTTLLRILCGIILPASGEVAWDHVPISVCRHIYLQDLFYLGHLTGNKQHLTVYENLQMVSLLAAKPCDMPIAQVIEQVGLTHHANTLAMHLSAGQQRRLALAKLLLIKVRLWILDEPFTGLDSAGVTWLETIINAHLKQGGMIVMTSHQSFSLTNIAQQHFVIGPCYV